MLSNDPVEPNAGIDEYKRFEIVVGVIAELIDGGVPEVNAEVERRVEAEAK